MKFFFGSLSFLSVNFVASFIEWFVLRVYNLLLCELPYGTNAGRWVKMVFGISFNSNQIVFGDI